MCCTLHPRNVFILKLKVSNLWPTLPHFFHPSVPGNHHSTVSMSLMFLASIYKWDHKYLSFSVWLISLSKMPSRSMHTGTYGRISFFSWLNNILLLYTHTPHFLYPFICWCTLRLLPCLGYCEYTAINMGVQISNLLQIYTQMWDFWIIW